MKVTILKGLPASWKSTWAKEHTNETTIRVNKDDLRAMMGGYSKKKEEVVLALRNTCVRQAIERNMNVIVDDTNLEEKHFEVINDIASALWAKVEVKLFDVPLSVCLERNRARPNPVPDKVIIDMAKRYNLGKEKHEFEEVDNNSYNNRAIIVDIDGTIAKNVSRSPYDYSKVSEDKPHNDIIELVLLLEQEWFEVLFVSGRDASCRKDTMDWIERYMDTWREYKLYMRAEGDKRNDTIVKYEILQELVNDYYIQYVLDDRDRVVKMWREAGLRCLQVAEGNF